MDIFRAPPLRVLGRHRRLPFVPTLAGAAVGGTGAGGLPTVGVFLDDGSGTFPYDITAYVRLVEGLSYSRGRSDQLSSPQAGALSLTLDNIDGRFTVGDTTYNVAADQKIRVTTSSPGAATLFTGYVQSWPVAWPGGGDEFAVASITAIDAQAPLSRRTLVSVVEEEYLYDGPVLYWPLGEASGATTAGNIAPGRSETLTELQIGTGGTLTFGDGIGPGTDGLSAPVFTPASAGNSIALTTTFVSPINSNGETVIDIDIWFVTTAGGQLASMRCADPTGPVFSINLSGAGGNVAYVTFLGENGLTSTQVNSGATSLADGRLHCLSSRVTFSGGNATASMILDGGSRLTAPSPIVYPSMPSWSALTIASVGVGYNNGYDGTLAHVALYSNATAISDARVVDRYHAGADGFTGNYTSSRISRLLGYAGRSVTTSGDTGLVQPAFSDFTGSSIWDEIQRLADAESGVAYIAGDGTVKLRDKNNSLPAATPAFTTTANQVAPDTAPVVDMQGVINYATGTRPNGANQVYSDTASIAAHERYPTDKTYLLSTDDEVLSRLQWLVNARKEPFPRVATLSIDVLTLSASDQALVLALDVGSTIRVTGWPSQSPTGSTADFIIEGFTMTITLDSWTFDANVTYAAPFRAWVLDDSTLSVEDSTTILYF